MADQASDAQQVHHSAHHVDGADEARRLAEWVLSPERTTPIVCLSVPQYLSEPAIDPDAAAELVGAFAEVWVLPGAQESWALSGVLPERLDVYGGAARLWWPIADADQVDPHDHPLFLIYAPDEAERVLRQIVDALTANEPRPEPGGDTVGIVTGVYSNGADIRLVGGHDAFAVLRHLSVGEVFHASEAVSLGQQVRVRISDLPAEGRRRLPVSLLASAPDPWERLAQVYEVEMIVEGVVAEFRRAGALVDLMPGVRGWLPNAQIAKEYVLHPEDHLRLDASVVVKIRELDPDERTAVLSLVDVPVDATARPPASIYPDGPPWLAPPEPPAATHDSPAPAGSEEPSTVTVAAGTSASAAPTVDPPLPAAAASDRSTPVQPAGDPVAHAGADAAAGRPDLGGDPPMPDEGSAGEIQALREVLDQAQRIRGETHSLGHDAARELQRLRGAARSLATELHNEITEASVRIAGLGGGRVNALAAAEENIAEFRRQVDQLRVRLQRAETERASLIDAQTKLERQLGRSHEQVEQERASAQRARDEAAELTSQLELIDGGDPSRRFLRELRHEWSRQHTSDADRAAHPFRAPLIGPEFLTSLAATHGTSRARVLEVCARVVSGRAHEYPSLELHRLRSSQGGDAPPRIRERDGATAWRVSLQVKSHSARRLHYWQLTDGKVELSKIGVHDDLTIV